MPPKETQTLNLDEALLLGRGHHKASYRHPDDPGLCVKIPYEVPDYDLKRELRYRQIRNWRKLPSTLLTEYYGTVATNFGTGYVFERVLNYDGSPGVSLAEFLDDRNYRPDQERFVAGLLQELHHKELAEEIIISDTNPDNYYIQQRQPGIYCLRIIDNIGSPAFFPVEYVVPILARRHVEKFWKRFLREIRRKYPHVSLPFQG